MFLGFVNLGDRTFSKCFVQNNGAILYIGCDKLLLLCSRFSGSRYSRLDTVLRGNRGCRLHLSRRSGRCMNRSAGDCRLFRRNRNIFKLRHFNNCRGFHRGLLIIEELIVLSTFDDSNGLSLNYAIVLYDKTRSKIDIVQSIINELPRPPHSAYFLCDSWYASNKLMDALAQKEFETIGALRTNRIIYPNQTRQQAKQFAPCICKDDPNVSLVTVGKRSYYVYRYQGQINGYDDAVVLLSYPENAFGEAKALRVFISTRTELSAQEILFLYANRWSIEVFFRSCKQKLAFDKCQLRKEKGITRMWLILSFVHFLCCTVAGHIGAFDEGYHYFRNCVLQVAFVQNSFSL